MERFRFVLGRVLEWYEKEYQIEENRLADCHQAVSKANQALLDVIALRERVEKDIVASPSLPAPDLMAFEYFRRKCLTDELRLGAAFDASKVRLDAQIKAVRAAQRKLRLLEKLKERRLAEHTYAMNRELEELAADSFLAKFNRER